MLSITETRKGSQAFLSLVADQDESFAPAPSSGKQVWTAVKEEQKKKTHINIYNTVNIGEQNNVKHFLF